MSETEFETYLSLLGRFLRLSEAQRAEIADEFRDHLEARLADLTAEGLDRSEAVRRALDEFGDAASLAVHFSQLARLRRRRFLMRCTFGTVTVLAGLILLASAFWPAGPGPNPPQAVVAQDQETTPADANDIQAADEPNTVTDAAPAASSKEQSAIEFVESRLDQPLESVEFIDMPLSEALEWISDAIELGIVVDTKALEEDGINLDDPVTLSITKQPVTARTVLRLVLRPVGAAYTLREGERLIHVTSKTVADENRITKVYNVRDLLSSAGKQPRGKRTSGGGGYPGGGYGSSGFGGDFGGMEGMAEDYGTGEYDGGMGGDIGFSTPPVSSAPGGQLVLVIGTVVQGPWVDTDGTGGTIAEFNGLLVISQTPAVHRDVEQLLEKLRAADGEKSDTTKPEPKRPSPQQWPLNPGGIGVPQQN